MNDDWEFCVLGCALTRQTFSISEVIILMLGVKRKSNGNKIKFDIRDFQKFCSKTSPAEPIFYEAPSIYRRLTRYILR